MYYDLPKKKIFIYGAGKGGLKTLEHLEKYNLEVSGFIDDFKTGKIGNIKIYKLNEVVPDRDIHVFIGTTIAERIILYVNRLKQAGFSNKNIWISFFVPAYPDSSDMLPPEHFENYLYLFEDNSYKEWLKESKDYINSTKVFKNLSNKCIEKKYEFLCLPEKIYDYEENNISIAVEYGDIVLDVGAGCSEETTLNSVHFFKKCKNKGRVYAFEANPRIYEKLLKDLVYFPEIKAYNLAVWSKSEEVFIEDRIGGISSVVNFTGSKGFKVNAVSIDYFIEKEKIEKVDFIKMDIEGAEIEALKGAEKTIKKFKPKLAICIYHHPSHFYKIPKLLKEFNPDYKLYMYNNEPWWWVGTKVFAIDINKLS